MLFRDLVKTYLHLLLFLQSRATGARAGNGRGAGAGASTSVNSGPRVVTVGPPSGAPGLPGQQLQQPQMMGPGMMLPPGVSGAPMWAPRPPGSVMTNGSNLLPMAPPMQLPPSAAPSPSVPYGPPSRVLGPQMVPVNGGVNGPFVQMHQQHPSAGPSVVGNIAPSPNCLNSAHILAESSAGELFIFLLLKV